jgi:hypothetical protein
MAPSKRTIEDEGPPAMSASSGLLADLENHFARYAALPPGLPLVLALWGIATHLFEVFDAFPYLAITSPTKQCGKTRVAELLELVSANPVRTVGISVAALFRIVESKHPTLLIDEAESLRGRDERAGALREILNVGYRKGQKVIRCFGGNGTDYKTREFETFCPKVLVLIGSLPDTLADRCLPVEMNRRKAEQLERFRFGKVKMETAPLRAAAKRWAKSNRSDVEAWYAQNDVEYLVDREAELWLPLFSVCALLGPKRLPELKALALCLARAKAASEPGDLGIKLLADIRGVFDSLGANRLSTADLVDRLRMIVESPLPGWSQGKGVDPRSLSNLLRSFGIQPANLRLGGSQVVKGYAKTDFEDAWSRYLPTPTPPAATSATGLTSQQDSPHSAAATQGLRSGSQNGQLASVHAGCSGVAGETPPPLSELAESAHDRHPHPRLDQKVI